MVLEHMDKWIKNNEPWPSPHTLSKTNTRWIVYLKTESQTIKLKENRRKSSQHWERQTCLGYKIN